MPSDMTCMSTSTRAPKGCLANRPVCTEWGPCWFSNPSLPRSVLCVRHLPGQQTPHQCPAKPRAQSQAWKPPTVCSVQCPLAPSAPDAGAALLMQYAVSAPNSLVTTTPFQQQRTAVLTSQRRCCLHCSCCTCTGIASCEILCMQASMNYEARNGQADGTNISNGQCIGRMEQMGQIRKQSAVAKARVLYNCMVRFRLLSGTRRIRPAPELPLASIPVICRRGRGGGCCCER